jgi:sugar (pentulose or hexulose) kinase
VTEQCIWNLGFRGLEHKMDHAIVGFNIGTSKVIRATANVGSSATVSECGLAGQGANDWLAAFRNVSKTSETVLGSSIVSVCGTSGTFLFVDAYGHPVGRPVLYNEVDEEQAVVFSQHLRAKGVDPAGLASSDSAAMKVWMHWNALNHAERSVVRWIVPQSVWVCYMLVLGHEFPWEDVCADIGNCRKFGGDQQLKEWRTDIYTAVGVPLAILPTIVRSGVIVGDATSEFASSCGVTGGVVVHGTTDASADALGLVGDTVGTIGLMAGSTTSLKAVVDRPIPTTADSYIGAHPYDGTLRMYTAWVTVGENLREICRLEGMSVPDLMKAAWTFNGRVPFVELSRGSIVSEYRSVDFFVLARAVVECSALWEAFHIDHISKSLGSRRVSIHMVGGTTQDERWMQLRADVFGQQIVTHEPVTTLGTVLPGLLLNGYISSAREFLDEFMVVKRVFHPRPMDQRVMELRDLVWERIGGK